MSNPIDSSSPSFIARVLQNDAARKGFAGAVAGLLVAAVSVALFEQES
jgi:hypothetical protein